MKKLLLTLSFLAFTINAHATVHYFHNGSPDNTLPCTLADPCDNFSGTTLDNAGAIAAGDSVLFKAGDEWNGLEAQLAVQSNGTSENRITFGRYGTGANPKFTGGASTTPTWTNLTGAIWSTPMTAMDNGNQPLWDIDADRGLMRTFANNNALEAGSWCFTSSLTPGTSCANFSTGSYLMIRRWDGSNPNTHPFYIDTNVHNSGNGDRGLVRTTTNSSYGDYVDFVDLDIVAPGGIGWSTSGEATRTLNMKVKGAPRDGMLGFYYTALSEFGSNWEDYYSDVSYSASFGVGYGQGITTYGPGTSLIGTVSHDNGMAGIDFLDFGTNTDVHNGLMMRTTAYNNGLSPQTGSFDTNVYCDGCKQSMFYGVRSYIAGRGSSGAGNARVGGVLWGSENPSDASADNDLLNSYAAGIHYAAFGTNNTTGGATISGLRTRFNTYSAYNAGSFERLTDFADLVSTAHHFEQFYSIWLGDNSDPGGMYMGSDLDMYYRDYNVHYNRGGNTAIFNASGSDRTLAQWVTLSGEDANSVVGDPLFVTDSDSAPDFHLQAGSPARDLIGVPTTFTYQSWVPQTVKTDIGIYGVKGATLADGTYDDVSVDADAGFHYDYPSLQSENVEPVSLVAGTTGNVNVTFVMPQYVTALKYNWKIKVVFPAGFTLSDGGATAVSNISGFNGGATASVSGQTVTVTRDGDGYSTFPTTISFTLSNIKNPTSAGSGGTYNIYTTDENDNQIATADNDIGADTFTTSAPPNQSFTGGYFKCTWVQLT